MAHVEIPYNKEDVRITIDDNLVRLENTNPFYSLDSNLYYFISGDDIYIDAKSWLIQSHIPKWARGALKHALPYLLT